MFKFLRSQAKLFYWVIAATFILFLFLGGLTSRGCQAPGTQRMEAGVVGSVNGVKISAQNYDYAYRQTLAQMRAQSAGRDLNANQYASAREMAWDYMVRNVIIEQALKEYDIRVSDEEVLDAFQNNPPPELLQAYRTQDGQIDMERYYADLSNPAMDWSQHEAYLRSILPRQKLENLLTAQAFVSDEEVRDEFKRQTSRAVAEYLGVLYAGLDTPEITEDEILAWYDANPDDYQSQKKYKCRAVRWQKAPSQADYDEVLAFMKEEIRPRIISGELTFEQAAVEYSEDSSAEQGGDLGVFDRNRMVEPFTEAAFSLPVGEISEPVKTKFGWHLIEVLEQDVDAETGEVFQVHARHILLKVNPSGETVDNLRDAAEAFRDRVDGSTFVATAEAEAMDLLDPPAVIEGRDIPSLPFSLAGTQWLSRAKTGNISPIFETDTYLYCLLAEAPTPAGLRPLDEVRGQVRLAVQKEKNLEIARGVLGPAVGEAQMGRPFEEIASGNDELKYAVTDTINMNSNVPDVGYGTDFNRMAIEGQVGEIVPEIETLRGLFALRPVWIQPFDETAFAARQDGIRAYLLNQKRAEILETWFEQRKAEADIVDQRHQLMQAS